MTYAHLLATLVRTVPERTAANELRLHVLRLCVCVFVYVWCMRVRTLPGRTTVQAIPAHVLAGKKCVDRQERGLAGQG